VRNTFITVLDDKPFDVEVPERSSSCPCTFALDDKEKSANEENAGITVEISKD